MTMSGETNPSNSSGKDETGFKFENSGLNKRCNDVFANLDALEKKHKVFEVSRAREDADLDKRLLHHASSLEEVEASKPDFKKPTVSSGRDFHSNEQRYRHEHDDRGDSQEFRKPMPPSRHHRGRGTYRGSHRGRGRSTPDYKLNPERWTEYSLEDVDTSDSSMKQAAFEFLNERKQLREGQINEDRIDVNSTACSSGLFTFNKPLKNKDGVTSSSEKKSHTGKPDSSSKHAAFEENDEESSNVEEDNTVCEKGSNLDTTDKVPNKTDDNSNSGTKRKADSEDSDDIVERSRPRLDIASLEESCENKNEDVEKPAGFKSRKNVKKSFRSRGRTDDEDDD